MSELPPESRRAFFAACPLGVSELLASELRELGIDVEREHPAGVTFAGRLSDGYRACLWSRTASRVLVALATGAGFALLASLLWLNVRADCPLPQQGS